MMKKKLFPILFTIFTFFGVIFGLLALTGLFFWIFGPEVMDAPFSGPWDPKKILALILIIPFVLIGIAGFFSGVFFQILRKYPGILPSGNPRNELIVSILCPGCRDED